MVQEPGSAETLRQEPELPNYNFVDIPELTPVRHRELQKAIRAPIGADDRDGREQLRLSYLLNMYEWTAIQGDLLDPKILESTFKTRGHEQPDTRMGRTRKLFAGFQQFSMDEMEGSKAFTEFVHRIAGVVKTGLDGKPEVIDYYKDSFTYVLSSLIDRTRDFYEYELGIKRDSDEGRKIAKDLCEFWYGVGQQAGLRQGPATVEDHDKFVEAHEARIFREMRASPSMQAKASLMAGRFMRSIAEYSNSSEDAVAKLMIKLRPETLGHLLGIDSREWPTEQIRARPSERKHKADVLAEDDPTVQALRRANVENDLGIATIIQLGHLGHLTKDELKRETVHVMRGEELTTEGKQPDKLYVVLGTTTPLEVTQKTPDGQDVLLDTIQPGGKPTVLMEGLVRRTRIATETVRAQQEGDVDVVSIPKEAFLALMEGGEDKRWIETAFLPKVQAISKRDESKRDELARQRMQSSDRKSAIE